MQIFENFALLTPNLKINFLTSLMSYALQRAGRIAGHFRFQLNSDKFLQNSTLEGFVFPLRKISHDIFVLAPSTGNSTYDPL